MLAYQLKVRKKEIVVIGLILAFALIATYRIYYKFKDSNNVDYNTTTIDTTFHEKTGAEVNITKVTPMTDSLGLSTHAYTFTIKNNTNASLKYSISIEDNELKIDEDDCSEVLIPHNLIKFAIHKKGEKNNIYTLSNLVNGEVLTRIIKANQEEEYTMRFWVTKDSLLTGTKLHYHGLIKVTDLGNQVALSIK